MSEYKIRVTCKKSIECATHGAIDYYTGTIDLFDLDFDYDSVLDEIEEIMNHNPHKGSGGYTILWHSEKVWSPDVENVDLKLLLRALDYKTGPNAIIAKAIIGNFPGDLSGAVDILDNQNWRAFDLEEFIDDWLERNHLSINKKFLNKTGILDQEKTDGRTLIQAGVNGLIIEVYR